MKWRVGQFWKWFDRVLLITLIIGVGLYWWEARSISTQLRTMGVDDRFQERGGERSEAPAGALEQLQQIFIAAPMTRFHAQVSRFARNLSDDRHWADVPESQTTDMREQNGRYDLAFALPRILDEKSVRISTAGNVLSLEASMREPPYTTYVKRFYIPFPSDQIGDVENSISNSIVRIRIQMKQRAK